MGYWQQAQQSYQCALNFTAKESERVGLLINRAVLARHQGQYPQARAFYKEAERIAKYYDNQQALAAIYNNLGSLQLDLGDLKGAEQFTVRRWAAFNRRISALVILPQVLICC